MLTKSASSGAAEIIGMWSSCASRVPTARKWTMTTSVVRKTVRRAKAGISTSLRTRAERVEKLLAGIRNRARTQVHLGPRRESRNDRRRILDARVHGHELALAGRAGEHGRDVQRPRIAHLHDVQIARLVAHGDERGAVGALGLG